MTIIPSIDFYSKYDEIVKKCRKSGEPIYLTNNNQIELVVMDIASFEKREQELMVQQLVLESYAARLAGAKDYTQEESMAIIDKLIEDNAKNDC